MPDGIKGIDTAHRLTAAECAGIKAAGYDYVGRYLVPPRGSLKWKAVTAEEIARIHDAGLGVFFVFEIDERRALAGATQGGKDGETARELAESYGIPAGTILYFAVDYDMLKQDFGVAEAYLRAAQNQLGQYKVGVYGKYDLVEYLHERDVCAGYWQCCAWSYKHKSKHLSIYQGQWQKECAGVAIDINWCVDPVGSGIWYREDEENMTREELFEKLGDKWIARFDDLPEWAKPRMRKILDDGTVNGGTSAEVDPDDINMPLSDVKVLIAMQKQFDKLIAKVEK